MYKGEKIVRAILICVPSFILACSSPKKASDNSTGPGSTLPATAALAPNTFRVEARVLNIGACLDSLTGNEYFSAELLLDAITGRGSSLVDVVAAGDTIQCEWQGLNSKDSETVKGKHIEAVIGEMPAAPVGSPYHFVIKSYHFK